MKNFKTLSLAIIASVFVMSCSDDDDNTPEAVNEEEVITTLRATLTPALGVGPVITLESRDLDGDGPNPPVIQVSGNMVAGTTYEGVILLLNETESPAEDITLEVDEEGEEHQFFYTTTGGLDISTNYVDFDINGNPVGIQFDLLANTASTGTLTFTLRHEPTKPNTGLGDAGGETDIAVTFNVTVE